MFLTPHVLAVLKGQGFTYGGDAFIKKDKDGFLYPFFDRKTMSLKFLNKDDVLTIFECYKITA